MKKFNFILIGEVEVPDNVSQDEVKNALGYSAGLNGLHDDNPLQWRLQSLPEGVSLKSVTVREKGRGKILYELDNSTARELAGKLKNAAADCGDLPVINSLTMPVPAGDTFSYIVYHKGDKHFEME